jgi:uncharacterized membrane protein
VRESPGKGSPADPPTAAAPTAPPGAAPVHVMDPVERMIHVVLLAGIAVSVVLMAAGLALGLLNGTGISRGVVPLADLPRAAWGLSPAALLSLGLIVLIATPFVRVAGSLIAFAREGDRRYVVLTAVVLAVMCASVLLGRV